MLRYIPFFILLTSLYCYGELILTTTILNSDVTDSRNVRSYVPLSVDILRTNGIIMELILNITNVVQDAKEIDLNVYDIFYTTNLIELPKTNSVVIQKLITVPTDSD